MKIYIAGPLCTKESREFLKEIDKICKEFEFETFLPHRDAGLYEKKEDILRISKKDKEMLHECNLLIGVLDGVCVGAGTTWEMGYMAALGKQVIGLKTDRKVEESIGDISVIIAGQVKIVDSLEKLKEELKKLRSI